MPQHWSKYDPTRIGNLITRRQRAVIGGFRRLPLRRSSGPPPTLASSLYRLLGTQIGNGYTTAKSRHIFRDFINAVGHVTLTEDEVIVRFQKRAHNPLLRAAGFADRQPLVPWLGDRRLRLLLG